MVRLFLPLPGPGPGQAGPEPAATARVEGPRLHYLVNVLRLREGDALEIFDGRGGAYPARVSALLGDAAELALGPRQAAPPRRRIAVVQGLPKGEKLELVIQKGTELGAAAFAPAFTRRAVVKLDERRAAARTRRWQAIAGEAARQCGRADVPEVLAPRPLLEAVEAAAASGGSEGRILVLDEEERSTLLREAHAGSVGAPLTLVVGPEGGLDREEVAALAGRGAVPVTLGPLVLRTETAALAALAVLRHLDGELG
jgi:16S rRNA (uracil1498-N3)-methyltransferase